MKLTYAGYTSAGPVRERNEDAILMRQQGGCALFLVADGIGGSMDGDVISRMIRDRFSRWWDSFLNAGAERDFDRLLEILKEQLNSHLNEIQQKAEQMLKTGVPETEIIQKIINN